MSAVMRLQLLMLTAAVAGCSVITAVDVCKPPPAPITASIRTESTQRAEGATPLIGLEAGGFLMISSSRLSSDEGAPGEVRVVRLSAAGEPLRTCDLDRETTLVDEPVAYQPSLAQVSNGAVVAVWHEADGIWGMVLTPTGCPTARDPFLIGRARTADAVAVQPHVLALEESRALVTWTEYDTATLRAETMGRVMTADAAGTFDFLPTRADPTGEPVSLDLSGSDLFAATTLLPGERIAVIWLVHDATLRVAATVLDSLLGPVVAARTISDEFPIFFDVTHAPIRLMSVGWDGAQLLVTWTQSSADAIEHMGRFFNAELTPLMAPQAPAGEPFRIADSPTAVVEAAVATPLDGGGFFLAWSDRTSSDASGRRLIRGTTLGPGGGPTFNAWACDAEAFFVAVPSTGEYFQPTNASGAHGEILTVFASTAEAGDDAGDLRSVAIPQGQLLP